MKRPGPLRYAPPPNDDARFSVAEAVVPPSVAAASVATAPGGMPIDAALRKGTEFLKAQGIEAARLEMELMMAESLGIDRIGLYMRMREPLPDAARDRSREMLQRRRAREPLAYILGRREFYGLSFAVNRATLVPRPETELLVDAALRAFERERAEKTEATGTTETTVAETADATDATPSPEVPSERTFADIGTGSGAIAVACAHAMARRGDAFRWIATDVSAPALAVARANAEAHGVADRVEFREGSLWDAFGPDETFDCVCSNPPYIPEGDRESLMPEVATWEPPGALFSGADGLDALRAIVAGAPERLRPGGRLFLEIGFGQGDAVRALLESTPGLGGVEVRNDYAGIPRIACATRIS